MSYIRPVRLPDRFYLPSKSWTGLEVYDVVPWDGASEYVTDGRRYGIRFENGSLHWLEDGTDPLDGLSEDFEGVDLAALVDGLRAYTQQHKILQEIWQPDLAALEKLRNGTDAEESKS